MKNMAKKNYNFVFVRYHELSPTQRFTFSSIMPYYVGCGYVDNVYKVTGFKTLREVRTFAKAFTALVGCFSCFDAFVEAER